MKSKIVIYNDTIKKWERKCPNCNINLLYPNYETYKWDCKTHHLCVDCYNKDTLNIQNKLSVFCKTCGIFRYNTNTKKKKEYNSINTQCKRCAQRGKISNRKGENMPISSKIILSEKLSGINHPQYGKPLSEEHKMKIRLKRLKQLESLNGKLLPNYNKNACKYFNELNESSNYTIQHAENGGEYYIRELGYWLDGYDKKRNMVYEWYEKHHFNILGKLNEKDIQRKNNIKKYLHCRFIGYDYEGKKIIDEY
jgi:hypothetical protein